MRHSVVDSNVNPENFNLCHLLGEGRCKVYEEASYNCALKVVDASKNKDLAEEVRKEASIYKKLNTLQGTYIPKLIWEGSFEGILECIALQPIGSSPSLLTTEQQSYLIIALKAIHKKGVLHTDLKKSNIIIDERGKPFIIDFGFAELCESSERFKAELQQFKKCISE